MFKKTFLFYFILNFIICTNHFESEAFYKYSIQNIGKQKSNYSISLMKSIDAELSSHFTWFPTSNFIINTKLINNFKDDNKIFYSFNFGFLFKNSIIGMNINSLKFDNQFNNINWNSYFLINQINIKNWYFNTMLTYTSNKDFSFFSISNYFKKQIFKSIDFNFGLNLTKISNFLIIPYFGVTYNL